MNSRLHSLFQKAAKSKFYLWLLNQFLLRGIPFNHPHKLKIMHVDDDEMRIKLPYRKVNLNHLKGIHACALATLCEYTCGLQLARQIDVRKFRLIMKDLHMEYHLQGKTDIYVNFRFTKEEAQQLLSTLQTQESVFVKLLVDAHDTNDKPICRAEVNWQVKAWDRVKPM